MKLYSCAGSPGTDDIPFNKFSFIVSDEIVEGQYTGLSGTESSADAAIQAAINAFDGDAWLRLSWCYNNYPNQQFTEEIKPLLDRYANVKPLNTVHDSNGSDDIVLEIGNTFISTSYDWNINGMAGILRNTPFLASLTRSRVAYANVGLNFYALPTECIQDGKFNFDTSQQYLAIGVGIGHSGNNQWDWMIGGVTALLDVPESWLALNGKTVYDEGSGEPALIL